MILDANGRPIQSEAAAAEQQTRMGTLMGAVLPVLAAQKCTFQEGADVGLNLMLNYFNALPSSASAQQQMAHMQQSISQHAAKIIRHKKAAEKAQRALQEANPQSAAS